METGSTPPRNTTARNYMSFSDHIAAGDTRPLAVLPKHTNIPRQPNQIKSFTITP